MSSLGPGPVYSLPSTIGYEKHDQRKVRSPQYTMAPRLKTKSANLTPGPGINISGLTRYGKPTSYAYSIAPRSFAKDSKKIGPGPANYDISKKPYVSSPAPPSYSLGHREKYRFKNQCPGPNAYAVKLGAIKKSAPAYSIGQKTELKTKGGSPGPASYPAGNLKAVMKKAPEYSINGRNIVKNASNVPGANAYDRSNYKPGKSSPSYSFGVRHSQKAPPYVVHCDNV